MKPLKKNSLKDCTENLPDMVAEVAAEDAEKKEAAAVMAKAAIAAKAAAAEHNQYRFFAVDSDGF